MLPKLPILLGNPNMATTEDEVIRAVSRGFMRQEHRIKIPSGVAWNASTKTEIPEYALRTALENHLAKRGYSVHKQGQKRPSGFHFGVTGGLEQAFGIKYNQSYNDFTFEASLNALNEYLNFIEKIEELKSTEFKKQYMLEAPMVGFGWLYSKVKEHDVRTWSYEYLAHAIAHKSLFAKELQQKGDKVSSKYHIKFRGVRFGLGYRDAYSNSNHTTYKRNLPSVRVLLGRDEK